VNAEDYRRQARQCRNQAERSFGTLRADFLAAAETWDKLAEQIDHSNIFGAVIQTNRSSRPSG